MKHQREDYNRIQDPEGKIGEDEPVFLLRGQDTFAPTAIKTWAALVDASGNFDLASAVYQFAADMEQWQIENGCKCPDGK